MLRSKLEIVLFQILIKELSGTLCNVTCLRTRIEFWKSKSLRIRTGPDLIVLDRIKKVGSAHLWRIHAVRFHSDHVPRRLNFRFQQKYSEVLGIRKRCESCFCRPQKRIWSGCSWKTLGSFAGKHGWYSLATGHYVIAFQRRSLR